MKHLEKELVDFLDTWTIQELGKLMGCVKPLFELYDCDEEDDWVLQQVGEENYMNVRLIRTVYLLSRLSEWFGGVFSLTKSRHPKLWERIEKEASKPGVGNKLERFESSVK